MCLEDDLESCKIIHIFLFQAFHLYKQQRRQCESCRRQQGWDIGLHRDVHIWSVPLVL